jgi:hypothetical protein
MKVMLIDYGSPIEPLGAKDQVESLLATPAFPGPATEQRV